jgi:putative hydrolase of the HAD superfamily
MREKRITTLFQDIGGILLTNGWDGGARQRAAEKFRLDLDELNRLHHQTFGTYEEGRISLDEYLKRVIFHRKRPFSIEEFRSFMFAQSQPYPEMIEFVRELKSRHGLRIIAVSNEGRELSDYRNRRFGLPEVIDFFITSCYVHLRKPDQEIYRMALDVSQAPIDQIVYVENTPMFVGVAGALGIQTILHVDYPSTRAAFEAYGLKVTDE